jgi:hypothetical protein
MPTYLLHNGLATGCQPFTSLNTSLDVLNCLYQIVCLVLFRKEGLEQDQVECLLIGDAVEARVVLY